MSRPCTVCNTLSEDSPEGGRVVCGSPCRESWLAVHAPGNKTIPIEHIPVVTRPVARPATPPAKHSFDGNVDKGAVCAVCGSVYESASHTQSPFDRIARQPREGDTLLFPGGHLSYVIEDTREWDAGYVYATRVELVKPNRETPFETIRGYVKMDARVWRDLVRFACSIETK